MGGKRKKKKRWKADGGVLRCTLCGKLLWAYGTNFVAGKNGVVCHTCMRTGSTLLHREETVTEERPALITTPNKLVEALDKIMVGQEEAKRAVSLAVWKQLLRAGGEHVPTGHLLLYGPTGCGKTYLATQAAKLAGLPHLVFDATTLSEAGYRGRDAADMITDYAKAHKDANNYQYGVIILDEVDKLTANGSPERQAYCRGTQHSLLKLLEGIRVEDLDSSKLLFILCGAFPGLGENEPIKKQAIGFERKIESAAPSPMLADLFVDFGMERELMGRVPDIAAIHPLTEEDMLHILLDTENSVFREYRTFFESKGVALQLPEEEARKLAQKAIASHTGARALRSEIDKLMEPLLFRLAENALEQEVFIRV